MDEAKIATLRAILGENVPAERLYEILDASNGSVERALDVYFHQEQDQSHGGMKSSIDGVIVPDAAPALSSSASSPNLGVTKVDGNMGGKVSTKKRSPRKAASRRTGGQSASKQARLDSFFGLGKTIGPSQDANLDEHVAADSTPYSSKAARAPETVDMVGESPWAISTRLDPETTDLCPRRNNTSTKSLPNDVPLASLWSEPGEIGDRALAERSQKQSCPSGVATFQRFSQALQDMADTTKRLVKLSALESFIREVKDDGRESPDADNNNQGHTTVVQILAAALDLVLGGRTLPPLNVSGSAVSTALQSHLGVSRNQLSKAYRQYGDLGDCAASFFQKRTYFVIRSSVRELSILDVSRGLQKISETDGRDAKQHQIHSLLRGCTTKTEIRFLVRLLVRNMRIGANLKTCLAALAMAMMPNHDGKSIESDQDGDRTVDTKEAIAMVQTTHDICPNLEKIVYSLLQGGFEQMKQDCSIQVMTPIAPMLAHPIHSLDEIRAAMMGEGIDVCNRAPHTIVMEWKYDGMRCQAHFIGTDVKLFSRHMLEITNQFPDVARSLMEALRREYCDQSTSSTVSSFIVDSEIVGVQEEGGRTCLLPFQELSTRRKKHDDGLGVRVKLFAFDLMLLNGESFTGKSLVTRQRELRKLFNETSEFGFVASQNLSSYDETAVNRFLEEAVSNGAEGLMMKIRGQDFPETGEAISTYEAGARSRNWLKVKRDYVDGFADTIDVVPIGAWYGNGRKARKSFLSPVLLAVYNEEEDVFQSISRCMSFTDAMYEAMREFYFRGVPYPKSIDSEDLLTQKVASTREPTAHKEAEDGKTGLGPDNDEKDGHSISSDSQVDVEDDVDVLPPETEVKEGEGQRVYCFQNRPSTASVMTNESPTIWFKPMEIFEVSFADLSLSRQHTAAAGLVDEEGRGVALRFPRFKRRRPDKKPEHATTSVEIAQLYAKQAKVAISGRL
jgi:ATP-dependent DNA ligase I